LVASFS